MQILVIEDDAEHAEFISAGLKQAGYNAHCAKDGMQGLILATESKYDALIVDRMLPKLDGLAVIETLRKSGDNTPVLVLSSLGKVEEKVKGLRSGGDDYLTKPFEFVELLARLEALTRRIAPEQTEKTKLIVSDLEMNLLSREVKRAGQVIDLQPKEFQLLEFLMRREGQVITRTMLLEGVWDFHFSPNTNLIDAQMSKVRIKVDKPFKKALIKTIKGIGYKVAGD